MNSWTTQKQQYICALIISELMMFVHIRHNDIYYMRVNYIDSSATNFHLPSEVKNSNEEIRESVVMIHKMIRNIVTYNTFLSFESCNDFLTIFRIYFFDRYLDNCVHHELLQAYCKCITQGGRKKGDVMYP